MTHLWGNVFLLWGIAILPQLEQQALFDLYDPTHRLNEWGHALDKASIEVIKCPSDDPRTLVFFNYASNRLWVNNLNGMASKSI